MFARVELLKTTPSTVSKSRPSKKQSKSRSNTKSKDLLRTVRSRAINTLRNPQYIYLPLSLSTIPKPPSQIPQNPKRERERERERWRAQSFAKMVQRLTYRKRHSYATKSNQHRVVKTPGKTLLTLICVRFYWVMEKNILILI